MHGAWPLAFVVLLVATGCGRGAPTGPSATSGDVVVKQCEVFTVGVTTATLDGTPWIPVSTRAFGGSTIELWASDCTYWVAIAIRRFRGLGTYDVATGDVRVELRCDGRYCGIWRAAAATDAFGNTTVEGNGSITVTAYTVSTGDPADLSNFSGEIEGTFAFTLDPVPFPAGANGTKVMTDGRFGSGLRGF